MRRAQPHSKTSTAGPLKVVVKHQPDLDACVKALLLLLDRPLRGKETNPKGRTTDAAVNAVAAEEGRK